MSTQKPIVLQSRDTNSIGARSREQIVSTDMCPPLTDVRIATCGISDARAGFTFVRHQPVFGQTLMTCDGEGRALVNGQWRLREIYETAYFPMAVAIWVHGALGRFPA